MPIILSQPILYMNIVHDSYDKHTSKKCKRGEISYASTIIKVSKDPIIFSAVIVADEKLVEYDM